MAIVNISGYCFTPLQDLETLKAQLKQQGQHLSIKGSILLSPEGINAFLAGTPASVEAFEHYLPEIGLPKIIFKKSPSQAIPFKKLLVRIKPEIITVGRPDVTPLTTPAPYVKPATLKTWLDEKKEIFILDTRNDYETHLGKFQNSLECDIKNFREFPKAIQALDPSLKEKTIVTVCTGGIRCEKAAPIMIEAGFKNIYQLEGGILQYFEDCQGAYYDGECFVFDQRIAVDATLNETETTQCTKCRMPVTPAEQQSGEYKAREYCPYCYNHPERRLHAQSDHNLTL